MRTGAGLPPPLPDEEARRLATETFDRNIVVTAGAGTGKTTLLLDRLINLLVREPDPLPLDRIVALTFTNKAADQIRSRLRTRLHELVDAAGAGGSPALEALAHRFGNRIDQIADSCRAALVQIERGQIGTIHSFAATLLRLFPIEAGVDPRFEEDDGSRFRSAFDAAWRSFLERELTLENPRAEDWRPVLAALELDQIESFARALSGEIIPEAAIRQEAEGESAELPTAVRGWLQSVAARGRAMIAAHPGQRKIEGTLQSAVEFIEDFLANGGIPARSGTAGNFEITSTPKDWSAEEVAEAKRVCGIAGSIAALEPGLVRGLCRLLLPFVVSLRESFSRSGLITFDGLLVRARDLLRDHPAVRAALKLRFAAILIDEFQDTDPIQYEIILYVAERTDRSAGDWREAALAPGKIFVVGDPKQSIYAFRRADIEAYLRVVSEKIEAQGGISAKLVANFRSHSEILSVVNGLFERLIRFEEGLQPAYEPIAAYEADEPEPHGRAGSFRAVSLLRLDSAGDSPKKDRSAETGRRREAEAIARWLKEEVLDRARIRGEKGDMVRVRPGDVAILMRTLTEIHPYLSALRRNGIAYVIDGEKHFFQTQEVVDAVNLLKFVANPFDLAAGLGLLRSPLVGLKDSELFDLHGQGLLYTWSVSPPTGKGKTARRLRKWAERLAGLREWAARFPVNEAMTRIFDAVPMEILVSGDPDGEQAAANLGKLRQMANEISRLGRLSFRQTVAELSRRVVEKIEEGEGALSEEGVDAVRIMSVHKAKGLEFPVVVLAKCQGGSGGGRSEDPFVQRDWTSGLLGLSVGGAGNLAAIYLADRYGQRENLEVRRLLYVAMTRAKEHLMISCAPPKSRQARTFWSLLNEAVDLGGPAKKVIQVGEGRIQLIETAPSAGKRRKISPLARNAPRVDLRGYRERLRRRESRFQHVSSMERFSSPSRLGSADDAPSPTAASSGDRDRAIWIGTAAHRFLEDWDFSRGIDHLDSALAELLEPLWNRPEGAVEELSGLFRAFLASPVYEEIAKARILGRELPFLMGRDDQVIEGAVDLVYELDGRLWVADYKTDRVKPGEEDEAASRYSIQAGIYLDGVSRALNRQPAGFKLIYLRTGRAATLKNFAR